MRKERRSRGKPYISATDDSVPGKMKKPNTFSNCTLGCSPLMADIRILVFSSDCNNLTAQL
jgi:hypothetical protein